MTLFDQVFGFIRDNAQSGSNTAGEVADWAIEIGLSFDQFNQILQQVSAHADASPAIIQYTQREMQLGQGYYAEPPGNGWILPVLLAGGLAWLATKD